MVNEEWYKDPKVDYIGPTPEGPIFPTKLAEDGIAINLLLVDYHYNYWRLKNYIKELEGKIYELEETLAGKYSDYDDVPF